MSAHQTQLADPTPHPPLLLSAASSGDKDSVVTIQFFSFFLQNIEQGKLLILWAGLVWCALYVGPNKWSPDPWALHRYGGK